MAMETGLLRALSFYSVQVDMGKEEKSSFHERIMAGAPFTAEERVEILEYCWTDVANTILVLEPMLRFINPAQALARGDFMRAVAVYEYEGVPTDKVLHDRLQANWTTITANLAQTWKLNRNTASIASTRKAQTTLVRRGRCRLVERGVLAISGQNPLQGSIGWRTRNAQ